MKCKPLKCFTFPINFICNSFNSKKNSSQLFLPIFLISYNYTLPVILHEDYSMKQLKFSTFYHSTKLFCRAMKRSNLCQIFPIQWTHVGKNPCRIQQKWKGKIKECSLWIYSKVTFLSLGGVRSSFIQISIVLLN